MILDERRASDLMIDSLYCNDCDSPWWTAVSSYDTEIEQEERISEFISFMRYSDKSNIPIFVGHSLFFRTFYKKRISSILKRNRPELVSKLSKYRLSNGTLLALTVQFIDKPVGSSSGVDALVIDADIIFDGGFHGDLDESETSSSKGTPRSRITSGITSGINNIPGISSISSSYSSTEGNGTSLASSISETFTETISGALGGTGAIIERLDSFRFNAKEAIGSSLKRTTTNLRQTTAEFKSDLQSISKAFGFNK